VRYLAQFPAGTLPLVVAALTAAFDRVRLLHSDDSAVVFETRSRVSPRDVPFVKNLFLVWAASPRGPLDASIVRLAKGLRLPRVERHNERLRFRVMYHIDGQLVACQPRARQTFETAISSTTGAHLSPRGQCQEYWVIGRRDWPMIYLGERLPGGGNTRSQPKGSLSPQVASLLVAASRPAPEDVFLDPFGGTGAIVRARLRLPVRKAIYSDTRLEALRVALKDLTHHGVDLLNDDALLLPFVSSGSVNAIVTDPPWGEFDGEITDYSRFASAAASSMARVLHPTRGRLVMLISRRRVNTMVDALTRTDFRLHPALDILVNGHPATVLRTVGPRGQLTSRRTSN